MQSLTKIIDAALSHNIFYEIYIFSILCKFLVQIYDLHFLQIITCAMYTKINKICNIWYKLCILLQFEFWNYAMYTKINKSGKILFKLCN